MLLGKELWPQIETYLLIDRKHSDKRSAISANKSRFHLLASYFTSVEFNRKNFNRFISEQKTKGYSISYINNFIKIAKLVDRYFKLNEVMDYTYFPEIKSVPLVIITPEEIEALANVHIHYQKMDEYINARQKTLILLLGTTGCRIGEALNLTFNDIYSTPPCCIFRDTKTNEDRTVPLSQSLYNLLQQLPRLGAYVFVSGRGKQTNQQPINRDLKERCKAIGLKKNVYCHLFRHSYITTMLENGVDVSDVGVIVGHRDPKTTMRYKNSLIGHYVDVAHMHPLLRQEMSWEQQVMLVRVLSKRLLNIHGTNVHLEETNDHLVLSVIQIIRPTKK